MSYPTSSIALACHTLLQPTNAACVHRGKRAVCTIATGADPEPEAMCGKHAHMFLTSTAHVMRSLDLPAEPAAG